MTTLIVEDEMAPVPDWVWLMALAEKYNITAFPEELEQFAQELFAAEREACAKLCEAQEDDGGEWDIQQQCANAIRARGQQ